MSLGTPTLPTRILAHAKNIPKNRITGFTIVELLIVIVVIAILAAISIVAYNGIQARANDTKIRAAANQLEKKILLWSIESGITVILGGSGSTSGVTSTGCSNGSQGFFAKTTYICTPEEHLVAKGVISDGFTAELPKNTYVSTSNGNYSLMMYQCGTGKYSLYWTLQSPSPEETANLNSLLSSCGNSTSIRDTWGMRAGKVIQL